MKVLTIKYKIDIFSLTINQDEILVSRRGKGEKLCKEIGNEGGSII